MAHFRIETVLDPKVGLYRCEIYYPDYSIAPFAVTKPIYQNHEHAMLDIAEVFKRNMPDKPLKEWPKQ